MISRVLKLLSLTVLVADLAAGQVTMTKSAVFLRKTIETYPEAERQPILDYLDGARIVADRVAKNFVAERDEEVAGEFDRLVKATGQIIDVRESVNMMRQTYGSVTSYEFRCQALETPAENPDVHDVQHARSAVYYSIRTTRRQDGELFLTVKTARIDNLHAVSYLRINDYSGKVPPWLQGKQSDSKERKSRL